MEKLYTVSKNKTESWLQLSGSAESYPLDHQGSPWTICFIEYLTSWICFFSSLWCYLTCSSILPISCKLIAGWESGSILGGLNTSEVVLVGSFLFYHIRDNVLFAFSDAHTEETMFLKWLYWDIIYIPQNPPTSHILFNDFYLFTVVQSLPQSNFRTFPSHQNETLNPFWVRLSAPGNH